MAILEGRWDCTTCGTRGNLGRDKICPSCGDPRPEGVRFYLPADAQAVDDPEQLAQARAGPDWLCDFCGASNAAANVTCRQCGGERGGARRQAVKEFAQGQVPQSGDLTDERPSDAEPLIAETRPSASQVRRKPLAILIGGVALLILFLAWPRSSDVEVRRVGWQREVDVERLTTVREEGWELPAGGRLVSQQRAVHHYDQVLDHYETRTREVSEQIQVGTEEYVSGHRDLGNGYFEEIRGTRPVYEKRTRTETYQEPVYRAVPSYATKYTYDIDRWLVVRTEKSEGNDLAPYWPKTQLKEGEREGPRRGTYTTVFVDRKGREHQLQFGESEWSKYPVGSRHRGRFNAFGKMLRVE